MNFYLDFEATQFSERIISIGCVAENGATFSCLVKPDDGKKLTKFITDLTGITQEDLDEKGLSADEAFNAFCDFVQTYHKTGCPTYYCYGSSDKTFLKRTIAHMTDFRAITFAASVSNFLVDYSTIVKQHLSTNGIALKKLVALIRHIDEVEQKHEALEDAYMLKECFDGLDSIIPEKLPKKEEPVKIVLEDVPATGFIPMTGSPKVIEKLNALRSSWGGQKRQDVKGNGDENNYVVKMTKEGFETKYFTSYTAAAVFLLTFHISSKSPKKPSNINETIKQMIKNPNFCGYIYEFKEA